MAVEQLQKFTNNATTTVPGTISNVATSITVATGTGALYPTLSGSLFFIATLVNTVVGDPGFGQMEIIKVTARSGDVMTVVRGQEGTSGTNFPAGVLFELRPTAQAFDNIYTEVLELETTKAPLASPVFTGNPTAPTPTLTDDDTSIATTEFVRNTFESYGNGFVNMIHNPHGSIRQESSAAVSGPTGQTYFADQWFLAMVGAGGVATANVGTAGPVSAYDPNHMLVFTATAKASLAAGDFVVLMQPVEGRYMRRLFMGTSSARGSWIRWRASASQSGTASISIRNGANDRSFVQSFSVTTTPTDYSLFVPGDTTGTWNTDNTSGGSVVFCFAAGTTFQTSTLGAWQAGSFLGANTQSNMLDTVNRQLNITDVQWTDAPINIPFQSIDYSRELTRCQRYFIANGTSSFIASGTVETTTSAYLVFSTSTPMRAAPTITSTGGMKAYAGGGSFTLTSISTTYWGVGGALAIRGVFSGGGMTVGQGAALFTESFQCNINARM